MSEYASNEVRIHAAKGNPMGLLGQVMFFVDYYSMSVGREVRVGEIYVDGRFTPPNLKDLIKEKEKKENQNTKKHHKLAEHTKIRLKNIRNFYLCLIL